MGQKTSICIGIAALLDMASFIGVGLTLTLEVTMTTNIMLYLVGVLVGTGRVGSLAHVPNKCEKQKPIILLVHP